MRRQTVVAAWIGLFLTLCQTTDAQSVARFDDESLFTGQSGAAAQPDWPGSGSQASIVSGDLTVTLGPSATGLSFNVQSSLLPGNELAVSGVENINVDLAGPPVFSLGFQFIDPTDGPNSSFDVSLISGGMGGVVVDTFNFEAPKDVAHFVGFVSDTAFDRIEVREVGGNGQNELYGLFFTGLAAGKLWDGTSGDWDTAANWSGDTTPIATDDVYISPDSAATISGPAAATTVESLMLDNQGAGVTQLNLAAGPLTITSDLVLSQLGESELNVGSGTLNVGGDTHITAGGTLRHEGGGTFNPTGAVNLAGGHLVVDSIGSLAPNWTSGTLEVTGPGGLSVFLNGALGGNPVSIDADKTLEVTNNLQINSAVIFNVDGGEVNAGNLTAFLGTFNANSGTVNVDGTFLNQGTVNLAGADVTVNTFDASAVSPSFTDGSLTIDGGSYIPFAGSPDFTISGDPGTPTLTLDNGATMALDTAGTFVVGPGSGDNGVVNVQSGSTLSTGGAELGLVSYLSDAIVNVSGAGSTWDIDGTLEVGNGNDGNQDIHRGRDQLNVSDGAEVSVDGVVTLATTGRINLSGGSITAEGWVRNADSQFSFTGGTLTIDSGSFGSGSSTFTLGAAGRPVLELVNGATHNGVNIDVTNAEWHVLSGSAVTTGTFDAYNATGGAATEIVVDGAGSSISANANVTDSSLIGRSGGAANLSVTNRGAFHATDGAMTLGAGDNSVGTATVDGLGSTITVAGGSGLFVGNEGQGTLNVTNGGSVTANILTVADSDTNNAGTLTSTITISGEDSGTPSTLNVTGASYIGGSTNENRGTGVLNVQAGGLYSSNGGVIGSGNGGTGDGNGTVNVTGAGSFWNAVANGPSDIFVGDEGDGELNVTAGGRVDADAVFIGRLGGAEAASMTVDGQGTTATVNVRGNFVVGNLRRGEFTLTDGALLNTATSGAGSFLIGNSTNSDNSTVLVDDSTINHNGADRFAVGDDSNGTASTMTVQNGGKVNAINSILFVADQGGSTGHLELKDPGSIITTARMLMGDNGAGSATISNGAQLIINNSAAQANSGSLEVSAFGGGSGTMTVTGLNTMVSLAEFLSVGDESTANGSLTIEDGATVSTAASHVFIARSSSSSTGVVTVQDLNTGDGTSGSTLSSGGSLYVGGNNSSAGGDGTLNVELGGTVDVTGELKLWDNGKVNLNGGKINAASLVLEDPPEFPFPVFTFNSGTFRFTADATLNSETLSDLLGFGAPTLDASQTLVVTDQAVLNAPLRLNGGVLSVGSVLNNDISDLDFDIGRFNLTGDNLTVGAGGLFGGAMVVDLGQTVSVTNQATIDAGAELTVLGDFSSGGLTNNGDFIVIDTTGSGKTIGGSVANPAGSAITVVGDITFADGVSGGGDFFGPGTTSFASSFSPGDSPAEVEFEGDLALAGTNTLLIEIAGPALGDDYDSLTVAGDAVIDGLLSVSLDDFTPTPGQQFTILSASSVIDNGLVLGGPDASAFSLLVGGDSVVLQAVGALLAGDYNSDGVVNIADYTVWRDNLGAPAGTLDNDTTGGTIGAAQYDLWKSNFGATLPLAGLSQTTVPEPSTVMLLLLGAAAVVRTRALASR